MGSQNGFDRHMVDVRRPSHARPMGLGVQAQRGVRHQRHEALGLRQRGGQRAHGGAARLDLPQALGGRPEKNVSGLLGWGCGLLGWGGRGVGGVGCGWGGVEKQQNTYRRTICGRAGLGGVVGWGWVGW